MRIVPEGLYHIPIMAKECISYLQVEKGKTYFDGTLGGGGHSEAILYSGGNIVATDRDDDAIAFAGERLGKNNAFEGRYIFVKDNFKNIAQVMESLSISQLDGAMLDLGISSHQIDKAERGFSYMQDAHLDMRMDRGQAISAYDIVNTYKEEDLADIIFTYGEERFSRRIAKNIVRIRADKPIETTLELSKIICSSVPFSPSGHAAKKTFQALRIAVNEELNGLKEALENIISFLKKGARLLVITFHSLEDRIVKQTFKLLSSGCICDKNIPVCICGHTPTVKQVENKGIKPTAEECEKNPRSRSATLRVIEKL